jgi:hypothetical protein
MNYRGFLCDLRARIARCTTLLESYFEIVCALIRAQLRLLRRDVT